MKRNKGFTLVELMIVVVIVGILSAVAVPMYSDYVQRGKIAEAMTQLSGLRVSMEQYYQDNRTYQSNPVNGTACGVAMPARCANGCVTKYFAMTCSAPTDRTYTIAASGVDTMGEFYYTINEQNAKSSTITAAGWTGNAACWATKRDGSC